jgi:hypothetical protein
MRQRAARLANQQQQHPRQQEQKQHQTQIQQSQQQQVQQQQQHDQRQQQSPLANAQRQLRQRIEHVDKQQQNLAQLQQITPDSRNSGSTFPLVKDAVTANETDSAQRSHPCHSKSSIHSRSISIALPQHSTPAHPPLHLPARSSALRQASEKTLDTGDSAKPRVQWDLGLSAGQQPFLASGPAQGVQCLTDSVSEVHRLDNAPSTRLTARKKVGVRAAVEEVIPEMSQVFTENQQSSNELDNNSTASRKRTLEVVSISQDSQSERLPESYPNSEEGPSEQATKKRRFGGIFAPLTNLFGSRAHSENTSQDVAEKSPEEVAREKAEAAAAAEREAEAALRAETLRFGLEAMGQQLIEERDADEVFEDVLPDMPTPIEPATTGIFSWIPFGRR